MPARGEGRQEFSTPVSPSKSGRPELGVRTSHFKGLYRLLRPRAVEVRPSASTTFKAALRTSGHQVGKPGADQTLTPSREIQQNTDRIARIAVDALSYGLIVRSVFTTSSPAQPVLSPAPTDSDRGSDA
jgi:hypothetical protein